jgi:outer membrane protein, heavy metal efflux system
MERLTNLLLALLLSALPAFGAEATTITLAAAQARTLERNPVLAGASAGMRAAEGAWKQARALPNPEFSIDYAGFGGTIPEPAEAETLYVFEQLLEIGGKRRARSRERELARIVSQEDAEIMRRGVLAEVRRRFVRVLGSQERTRILEEALRTAEAVQRTVHDLVVAGEVSPIEERKVEADASLARIDLKGAASGLAVARQELAEMWGARAPDFESAVGTLEVPATIPARPDLEERIASLPDIARGGAEVARLEAALDSEKKKRIPELALSAGVQQYRAFGDHSFVAGVKIPLPIFDRNAGAVAEASSRLEQGAYERSAAEARAFAALATSHERLTAMAGEVVALRDTVLPRTREVLEGIEEGYRRGKFRLLDLLDARRSVAAAELRYNDALVELSLAAADVERWTGTSLGKEQGEMR